ncbi:MAG: anion permease [Candidatus Scatovivens sp.]
MFIYFFTFIIIAILILTNAITDAPNAIATLVGTKVMSFKKAAYLSACFNLIGIIIMCFINISVADCISSIIKIEGNLKDIIILVSSMISVISFALIAMKFGIPTSETHGLIAGLTGSAIAMYGIKSISYSEWKNVLIGLGWSILGTLLISYFINLFFMEKIKKLNKNSIKKSQILSCIGMSFMHGAQDGQKFIGVLIIFLCILKGVNIPTTIDPIYNIWSILFVAILMAMGVSIGGKSIVQNIGSNMAKINNEQALMTDIVTVITLLIASLTGLPVSTTHVKTISIAGIGKLNSVKVEKKNITDILKAWIWTFPICGLIGFVLTKILVIII